MKTHLVRSLKYFVQLAVLLALLFLVMELTHTAKEPASELFTSPKGWLLCGLVLVLSAVYPAFGYTDKRIGAHYEGDREKIFQAFDMGNQTLVSEHDGVMRFRAQSPVKRLLAVGQDEVTVTRERDGVIVSGRRKEVTKVDYRLRALLEQ